MRTLTGQYENSHGHKPRGDGYWAFRLTGTDGAGRFTSEEYFERGTLSEARAAACRRMKREIGGVKRVVEVEVLP
jgi:hypothetical protein